jgi:hypothetical protein
VPRDQRPRSWHPVVHDEMEKKDHESGSPLVSPRYVYRNI